MSSHDRRARILASTVFNGIDFVEVANQQQTKLRVHFLNSVAITLTASPTISGGETIPSVAISPVTAADWGWDDGHAVLTLNVIQPGDFSIYTLQLAGSNLDEFLSSAAFSFKAGCPSDLDCVQPAPNCPPTSAQAPNIDYLAKDFLSFRQALLDFSTQNYPNWQERSEADFGVMFLEALAAIGDDLSYTQDRIAAEASLLTATQRRSAMRHARLVDYHPRPTVSATTMLQFDLKANTTTTLPHGLQVMAPGADGIPIVFETGMGLNDKSTLPVLDARWNDKSDEDTANIEAYWFDDSVRCLQAGATSMYVKGHGYGFYPGQALLIETKAAEPLDPPLLQVVQLLPAGDPAGPWAHQTTDQIFNQEVTRIAWRASSALTVARDLGKTKVIGNLVPATQGRTISERFASGPQVATDPNAPPLAIVRAGPNTVNDPSTRPQILMHSLANAPLTWLPASSSGLVSPPFHPEIALSAAEGTASDSGAGARKWHDWTWYEKLLQAGPYENAYTLDPATYSPLGVNSDATTTYEYDGDSGDTIRFGDGTFGSSPEDNTLFSVTYRVGMGALGNVAAGAISRVDPASPVADQIISVTNPFAATGGADPESLLSIQRLAPQQFRSVMERAVLPSDYSAAAQTLPFVKRAATSMRWTGSWLTTFTTPEPKASEDIQPSDKISLITLLNRFRMAGTESYVPDPIYVSIDLAVQLCAQTNSFAAQVQQEVTAALAPVAASNSDTFFAVSTFGFGQPLYRAALEAAIQAVPGVAGVTSIRYRLRDRSLNFTEMGDAVAVGASQILRCDNDPSRPNSGALSISVGGGR